MKNESRIKIEHYNSFGCLLATHTSLNQESIGDEILKFADVIEVGDVIKIKEGE